MYHNAIFWYCDVTFTVSSHKALRPLSVAPRWRSLMRSEEARQQARAEGLTLRVAENTTGYFGVHLHPSCKAKPYKAQVKRGSKDVQLGSFATAEEAALCVARSPEGQAAAEREASATLLSLAFVRRSRNALMTVGT